MSPPLARALETAEAVLPPAGAAASCASSASAADQVQVAARRRPGAARPGWDVSALPEEDGLWSESLEPPGATCERGYAGLRWLWAQPERHILVAAHGGILECVRRAPCRARAARC